MFRPKILLISNESSPGDAAGQINGYELLVESGEIASFDYVSHAEGYDAIPAFDRVMAAISGKNYDLVVLWSPKNFPNSHSKFETILSALGNLPILYWEGDAWGRISSAKPITPQMRWWLQAAEIVFTTTLFQDKENLEKYTKDRVIFMPNTYCHLYFSEHEKNPPLAEYKYDACLIGNNASRFPIVSGLPGSIRRFELVARLKTSRYIHANIYGSGWPRYWSSAPIHYGLQCEIIRTHRISLNWDHFPSYSGYSSDRLPISLIAGRPHITTQHPGMSWIPSEDIGLFQVSSPSSAVDKAKQLLQLDPKVTWNMGLEAHKWARERMSHRMAARVIISYLVGSVAQIQQKPWADFY